MISVVIPIYNEADNVGTLVRYLEDDYEIIVVNDCSTDDFSKLVFSNNVTVINLAQNYGQSVALSAGFDHAHGDIIISMDGDLQHDPKDIPRFIEKINEGYDVVSSYRVNRNDGILRRLPSFIANKILRMVTGVNIRDFGSTFKAYRRETIENIEMFGEYHRYLPALVKGLRICEIPIEARPRLHGKSNYGLSRIWAVMLDIITLKFVMTYLHRPMRIFGSLGLMLFMIGSGISLSLVSLFCLGILPTLRDRGSLLLLSVFLMLMGAQFIIFGLGAEITSKIYYKVNDKKPYRIK